MCCSEIAGDEGIPVCHRVPLWLPTCLLLLLCVGGAAALEPSVLLHFVLAEIGPGDVIAAESAAPAPASLLCLSGASNQRSVRGGSFVNTAGATSWALTLAREASSSRPLKCVDLELISNSLDFSCQETCY